MFGELLGAGEFGLEREIMRRRKRYEVEAEEFFFFDWVGICRKTSWYYTFFDHFSNKMERF